MLGKLRDVWGRWRESRRQYQLERALYKAAGNPTGVDAVDQAATSLMASGAVLPRIEAPKGKAPDPEVK